MALFDISSSTPTVADGAQTCRYALKRAIKACEHSCKLVLQQCDAHTRQAIQEELGSDSAELASVYADVRQLSVKYGNDPGNF